MSKPRRQWPRYDLAKRQIGMDEEMLAKDTEVKAARKTENRQITRNRFMSDLEEPGRKFLLNTIPATISQAIARHSSMV